MEIDREGVVVSTPALVAPLSGLRVCAAHIESMRNGVVVGAAILGDLLRLRTSDGDVELVVRRVTFAFSSRFDAPLPLRDPIPAELVPLLKTRPDGFRERCIVPGDRFRIRAAVELQPSSAARFFFVADDRALIRLDEALSLTP